MHNLSGGHVVGNRNSTPEANAPSSLRPLSSRTFGSSHGLRASADLSGPLTGNRIRPSSDVYTHHTHGQTGAELDPQDKIAQQWIADIDQYETTLEEMAAATLDQDFKDELSAIDKWFRVLSEAERTAALYALLQQTTQVQVRFFIQVLQQMGKNHPMSGVLSPASFEKDPMSNRLSDAMSKLNVDSARNSLCRPSAPSASAKRQSGLDPTTINALFPDAAAAIASEKAKYTQQIGNPPASNRTSLATDPRASMHHHTLDSIDLSGQNALSPWGVSGDSAQGKVAMRQPSMGQFVQPPPSAGLRSPHPLIGGNNVKKPATLNLDNSSDLPLLSPYGPGNWTSNVNTPMAPSFVTNVAAAQADMYANAQAMKLAALSTVNNRFALDDVRKYRRARSNDGSGHQPTLSSGQPGMGLSGVMINEHGQMVGRDQLMALQAQQLAFVNQRSASPGIMMQQGLPHLQVAPPSQTNHGYLSAYDIVNGGPSIGINQLSIGAVGGHEGYLSDHSDMVRGRSPRGRRGSSRPPEDPTDPSLLQDIPSWLRSQRLHKYTDHLKDMKWTELVELDEKGLEDRGVNALGARNKMLKVFEQIKEARAEGKLDTK